MVCRKRSWHSRTDCDDSDVLLTRQFSKVRKLNSDLFSINGTTPPRQSTLQTLNTTTSRLLALPPEVRIRIYSFVFGNQHLWIGQHRDETSRDSYHIRPRDDWYAACHRAGAIYHLNTVDGSGSGIDLRVLRTCRQVFTEAALLPYRLNEFTFQDDVVRRNFERIVRPGKKLAQRKAVGRHGAMGRKEFLLEVMGLEVGAQGRVVWKGRVVFS